MSDQEIITELGKLKTAVNRVESMLSRMQLTKRYMTIPEAAKHYSISESRFRLLCKDDIIEGCYSLMNVNAEKKHYIIDSLKLDEMIDKGGMIAFVLNKYMKH